MEMKKKKFLPVQKLPRKLLGMLKWDSPTLLSANSLRMIFFFYIFLYLGFLIPHRNAERTVSNHPIWIKTV